MGNSKGNEFLIQAKNIEEGSNFRWYNVLHSIGWEYQKYQDTGIADLTLDSKNREAVQEVILKTFEQKILQSILFGNSEQYELFYISNLNHNFKLRDDIKYSGLRYERILTVCSRPGLDKRFTISYLNEDYSKNDLITEESLKLLKESKCFIEISRGLVVNKLWIGDIDIANNRIKFIRPSNYPFIFNIDEFSETEGNKPHLVKYLYSLISTKKLKSSEEFQAPYAYFHFT